MFQLVGICGLSPDTFVISPFGIFQSLEQHHGDGKASRKWGRKLFLIFCISLEMVILLSFGMIIGFLWSSNWFIWWEGGFWPWLGLRYQGKPFLGQWGLGLAYSKLLVISSLFGPKLQLKLLRWYSDDRIWGWCGLDCWPRRSVHYRVRIWDCPLAWPSHSSILDWLDLVQRMYLRFYVCAWMLLKGCLKTKVFLLRRWLIVIQDALYVIALGRPLLIFFLNVPTL